KAGRLVLVAVTTLKPVAEWLNVPHTSSPAELVPTKQAISLTTQILGRQLTVREQVTGPAGAGAEIGQGVSSRQMLLPLTVAKSPMQLQSKGELVVKGPFVITTPAPIPRFPTTMFVVNLNAPLQLVLISWIVTPLSGTLPLFVTVNTST